MVVSSPLLDALDYLSQIDANQKQLLIGAFFLLVTGIACAGIAIALYPVLQKNSPGLALGSVGFRLIESAFDNIGVVCLICY
jgi:hypothetical protein